MASSVLNSVLAVALSMVVSALLLAHPCNGKLYKVGDSSGWTTIGNVDYKQWSATKIFRLGDVIVFNYNPKFHNVMQVSHMDYKACNASSPIATHTTGNDSITITNRGHHLFICGVPGHCQAGQKVDINVLRVDSLLAPTPSVASTPATPDSSASNAQAPSSNEARSPLQHSPAQIALHITLFVFLLCCLIPLTS